MSWRNSLAHRWLQWISWFRWVLTLPCRPRRPLERTLPLRGGRWSVPEWPLIPYLGVLRWAGGL
jgi:hypothetical protein